MTDSLNRLVRARDKRTNTPRQLEATERQPVMRWICFDCRQVPCLRSVQDAWLKDHPGGYVPSRVVLEICPTCGGKMVEVS